jgi:cbb3-type cytochrome oxidase maturation protein
MYYPYFITYMILGFAISLLVFFWALKNGQFRDQARARFLPLQHEPPPMATKVSRLNRYEVYALLFLVVAGLVASIAVLAFALLHGG